MNELYVNGRVVIASALVFGGSGTAPYRIAPVSG